MSQFAVEIVCLDDVQPHPNADRLDLAVVGGYRAVVQKDLHRPGDIVVYVPEDAVLPPDVLDAFGFTGKLAGKQKNRVRAIRLRGELSQGLVLPLYDVLQFLERPEKADVLRQSPVVSWLDGHPVFETTPGTDYAALLGIEKWEEPIPVEMAGIARPRPDWFPPFTDIENIKRYPKVLEEGEMVVVSEKLHGTCFAAGMRARDREMLVSSRRIVLERDATNLYWRAALQHNLEQHLNEMLDHTGAESAVIFGEVYGPGVQDLAYDVPAGEIELSIFDIMLDEEYVDWEMFVQLVGLTADVVSECGQITHLTYETELPIVPILYLGDYSDAVIAEFTVGQSFLAAHIREGIVIRPAKERRDRKLGRVILKSVSPDYLLRKGNPTERH